VKTSIVEETSIRHIYINDHSPHVASGEWVGQRWLRQFWGSPNTETLSHLLQAHHWFNQLTLAMSPLRLTKISCVDPKVLMSFVSLDPMTLKLFSYLALTIWSNSQRVL